MVENAANAGGDALEKLYFEIYRPDDIEVREKITTEDTDTAFDAFAAAASG